MASNSLKFLIRHKGTRRFFKHPGQWVRKRSLATDYGTSAKALVASLNLGLKDVQFLMDSGKTKHDSSIDAW